MQLSIFHNSKFWSVGIASNIVAITLVGSSNVLGTVFVSSLMDEQQRKSFLITSFYKKGCLNFVAFFTTLLESISGNITILGRFFYILSFSLTIESLIPRIYLRLFTISLESIELVVIVIVIRPMSHMTLFFCFQMYLTCGYKIHMSTLTDIKKLKPVIDSVPFIKS